MNSQRPVHHKSHRPIEYIGRWHSNLPVSLGGFKSLYSHNKSTEDIDILWTCCHIIPDIIPNSLDEP